VRVVTREEYDAWLTEMKPDPSASQSPAPDAAGLSGIVKEWDIELSSATSIAGAVSIGLTNSGTVPHEFIVVRTDLTTEELLAMVDSASNRLDEAMLDAAGEQPEFAPGEVKQLTLDLSPGKYIVLCNIAGHFSNGMYAPLEILAN
jgi:uncharacterized cupredoxin-like copper-binding protein